MKLFFNRPKSPEAIDKFLARPEVQVHLRALGWKPPTPSTRDGGGVGSGTMSSPHEASTRRTKNGVTERIVGQPRTASRDRHVSELP